MNHEPWGSPVDDENGDDRRGRRSHTGHICEAGTGEFFDRINKINRIFE